MNLLSVLFWNGSSSSYFLRKLFELGTYVNSLDHLDCSHGVMAVFCNNCFISGGKYLIHQRRQLLELALVFFLLTIWIFKLCMFCSQSNQDEFTVNLISRRKFIFLFFKDAIRIWSLCKFSWSFGLQSWCTGSIL